MEQQHIYILTQEFFCAHYTDIIHEQTLKTDIKTL